MKGNEEEAERRGRVTDSQELSMTTLLYISYFCVISTACGPPLSRSTLIMPLRFISDLTESVTVSLSAQQTEN